LQPVRVQNGVIMVGVDMKKPTNIAVCGLPAPPSGLEPETL